MPVISSGGGLWTAVTNGANLAISSVQHLKALYVSPLVTLTGHTDTGKDLVLKANDTDGYSKINIQGLDDINYYSNADHDFYKSSTKIGAFKAVASKYGIEIKETASVPTPSAGYGYLYTKADNKLYFTDGAGTEHEVQFV